MTNKIIKWKQIGNINIRKQNCERYQFLKIIKVFMFLRIFIFYFTLVNDFINIICFYETKTENERELERQSKKTKRKKER